MNREDPGSSPASPPTGSGGSPRRPSRLHVALVLSDLPRRLPLWVAALAAGALLSSVPWLYARPWLAALVLALASVGDLALLALLPRLRLSFGPLQPPWILFAAGRSATAALVGLAPVGPVTAIATLAAVQLGLGAAAIWGAVIEPFRVEHTELTLGVPALSGPLRVLLISDLHMERRTRREEAVIRAALQRRPDLILFAGDLLNLSFLDDEEAMRDARWFLSQLAAPAGVLLVRGTPEVDPLPLVQRLIAGSSIELLEDRCAIVSHGAARLGVIGLPADRSPEELAGALAGLASAAPGIPRLCLHHTPDLIEEAARLGLELYLAGHTHGGQICAPLIGPLATASRFGRRYARGYHRLGTLQAFVSRGLGFEGLGAPRLRFLAPPELLWLELTPDRPLDLTPVLRI